MNIKINPSINLYNSNNVSFSKIKETKDVSYNNKINDAFLKESPKIETLVFKNKREISGVNFSKPVLLKDALNLLGSNKEPIISYSLSAHFHLPVELLKMAEMVSKNDDLKNVKVKSLLGFGAYSLAFETEKGEVLKISEGNQFYDDRKQEWFDLPIRKQGKLGKIHYYYFEEKVNSDFLSQEELMKFITKIKNSGYDVVDYCYKYSFSDSLAGEIKAEQFGRAKNGKIYLIDPGCARELPKTTSKIHTALERIKELWEQVFGC